MITRDTQSLEIQAGLGEVIEGFEKTLKMINDGVYVAELLGNNPGYVEFLKAISTAVSGHLADAYEIKEQVDEIVGVENE